MKYLTNKLTHFKQWILSIVINSVQLNGYLFLDEGDYETVIIAIDYEKAKKQMNELNKKHGNGYKYIGEVIIKHYL